MRWFKNVVDTVTGKKRRDRLKRDRESQKVGEELIEFLGEVIKDWNSTMFADKVKTPGDGSVQYLMENGWKVSYKSSRLEVITDKHRVTYSLGYSHAIAYAQTFNRIVEIINEGSTAKRATSTSGKTPQNTGHPKRKLYETLTETIRLRTENLSKLSKDDPSRKSLEIELEVVVKKARRLKEEHGFE